MPNRFDKHFFEKYEMLFFVTLFWTAVSLCEFFFFYLLTFGRHSSAPFIYLVNAVWQYMMSKTDLSFYLLLEFTAIWNEIFYTFVIIHMVLIENVYFCCKRIRFEYLPTEVCLGLRSSVWTNEIWMTRNNILISSDVVVTHSAITFITGANVLHIYRSVIKAFNCPWYSTTFNSPAILRWRVLYILKVTNTEIQKRSFHTNAGRHDYNSSKQILKTLA